MVIILIAIVLLWLVVEVLRMLCETSLSKRYFKKMKGSRGSPFYRGQAPYVVVKERGREKAYYCRPKWMKSDAEQKQRRFGWILKLRRRFSRNSSKTVASR